MTMSKNKKLSNLTYCRADIGGEKIQVQAAGALVSDKKRYADEKFSVTA